MRPTRTWILLADGAQARFLENLGPGKGLQELSPNRVEYPHPPNREIDSDRPGRVQDRAGPGRHAMEPHTEPHDKMKLDFAKSLADGVNAAEQDGQFDRLIVAAPAKVLGELRHKLSKTVQGKLLREVDKDLIGADDKQLAKQFADDLLL